MSKIKFCIVLIYSVFVFDQVSTQAQEISDAIEAYDADDYSSALPIFQSLADRGDDDAMWYMGQMYDNGRGVEQSDEHAFNWFEQSAELGDADAQWEVGIMYEIGQWVDEDQKKAFEWYLEAAKNGRYSAMNEVGDRYSEGNGVRESEKKAREWYGKGADGGHGEAQANYGVQFEFGKGGVRQSDEKALYWYQQSADQGTALGQAYLGEMYESGTEVAEDLVEARRLYELAAAQDNEFAIDRLKEMGSDSAVVASQGNSSDDEISAEDALDAFRTGMVNSQLSTAAQLVQETKYEEAYKIYFKLASDDNNARAQYFVGAMNELGYGTPQSWEKAVKWTSLAAEADDPDAQLSLGVYYMNGNSNLSVDRDYGLEWIKKSARNGHEVARQTLTEDGITW